MNKRPVIPVYPAAFFETHHRLWQALGGLFQIQFRAWLEGDEQTAAVVWMAEGPEALVRAVASRGGRCLVWAGREPVGGVGGEVSFASAGVLDPVLRGRSLPGHRSLEASELRVGPGAEVLASMEGRPIWVREVLAGGGVVDRLAAPPPVLADGQLLRQHLKPWNCVRLLPLVHVLRESVGDSGWEAPPPRACFIFDDPSLHWPSYGCLRFDALARHAETHGYHAAIATVPQDAWGVNPGVRALFARQSAPISLLIHGNDHVRHEMWTTRSEREWTQLLAQSLRRVAALERQEGLSVARVMEAPHARVSRDAFGPMGRVGYEGALVSPALAGVYARQAGWPVTVGCAAVEAPLDGVCALPRVPLSSHWRADVMVASFLRQPVIVAGHHQDAAEGLDFLAALAAQVNRIDGMRWTCARGLVRMQHQTRREGSVWSVRLGARVAECVVPPGVTAVRLERPWDGGREETLVVTGLTRGGLEAVHDGAGVVLPLSAMTEAPTPIRVESRPGEALDPEAVPSPRRRLWPAARRILAEARDRSFPYVPRALRCRPPAFRVPLSVE